MKVQELTVNDNFAVDKIIVCQMFYESGTITRRDRGVVRALFCLGQNYTSGLHIT